MYESVEHVDHCVCHTNFCQAVHISEKFLFPFMVDFSLVCAILLFITWNNAGKKPPQHEEEVKPVYKFYNSYSGESGDLMQPLLYLNFCGKLFFFE